MTAPFVCICLVCISSRHFEVLVTLSDLKNFLVFVWGISVVVFVFRLYPPLFFTITNPSRPSTGFESLPVSGCFVNIMPNTTTTSSAPFNAALPINPIVERGCMCAPFLSSIYRSGASPQLGWKFPFSFFFFFFFPPYRISFCLSFDLTLPLFIHVRASFSRLLGRVYQMWFAPLIISWRLAV